MGGRILTTWKYLLPIFKASDRRNYLVEVLLTLYNCYFVYSLCQAKQLLWSRFINTHGLPHKNIAADLHMEHLNRLCKEIIKGLEANKTLSAIKRIGDAIGPLHAVLEDFDNSVLYSNLDASHKFAISQKDRNKILSIVLDEHKERSHSCFSKFQSIFSESNEKKLKKWMIESRQSLM